MLPEIVKAPDNFSSLSYTARMIYRNLQDLFVATQKMDSEPIVINNNEVKVWMVGHATTLINLFGTTILTDPVLSFGLPLPKRLVAHGYNVEELPPLDYVVVSHLHLDHCSRSTLRELASRTTTIILPKECRYIVEKLHFKHVVELDWGKTNISETTHITAYRPEHWGQRFPWERTQRGYNCYVIEKNGSTIFFGGDTGYGDFFKKIGDNHAIDIALLPISAYNPAYLRKHHMDPSEAHQAFKDLRGAHCVPIHWGSFRLGLEPMHEPPKLFHYYAEQEGLTDRIHILTNGQSFSLEP